MKKIMVRADDLGYSMGVNFGIARSVVDGIITSVGFMTNMPDAEHGLALLKGTEVCLGQHTNICVGRPLTVGNTKVYMHMESMFKDYDPFKTLKNMVENAHEDGCDILVCHPGYLDAYILRTSSLTVPRALEVEMACDPAAREYLEQANVQIVTYRDL